MKSYILIFFIFFTSLTKAIGCICIGENIPLKEKIEKEYSRSDIIFTGNVIAIKDLNTNPIRVSSADPIQYTFEIIEQIKGVDTKRKIQIISTRNDASCGYRFQIGKTYMVYALNTNQYTSITGNNIDHITSICNRNNHVARVAKKEKKLLKKLSQKEKVQ